VKPVLILDAYLDERGGARNLLPHLGDWEVEVVRCAREPLPATSERFAAVLVTGSAASVLDDVPWIHATRALLADAVRRSTAVLGICFGHQLLAQAVGGSGAVRRMRERQLGWTAIKQVAESALLRRAPAEFVTFVSHADEVVPGVDGLRILARSEACAVEAFEVQERPAWGVQFHAEMGLDEACELARERDLAGAVRGARDSRDLARALMDGFVTVSLVR
jgi:GMP synthase (glutamine-hydrolysing)